MNSRSDAPPHRSDPSGHGPQSTLRAVGATLSSRVMDVRGPGGVARNEQADHRQRRVRNLPLWNVHHGVGRARDFTRRALTEWHWNPEDDEFEDVLLAVSELVANACAHAGGATELALAMNGDELTVSVSDATSALPDPRLCGGPSEPGGHGLRIVTALAASWGTLATSEGKTVWAVFRDHQTRTPGSARPAGAEGWAR